MASKVTIQDIAREAGVSAATVSYVINNRPDKSISEETKQKVWQIVNLFNYKPSAFAKKLRSSPDSKLIAVCTSERDSLLFKSDFMCFIDNLHNTFPIEKYGIVLSGLPYRRLDNIDAIIAYDIDEKSFLEIGNLNFVPLIAVDCIVPDSLFFKVSCDYTKLKMQADEHFKDDYVYVCSTPANLTIKEEVEKTFKNVKFINSLNELLQIQSFKNILTTNTAILEYLTGTSHNIFFPDELVKNKCNKIMFCLEQVLQRTPFAVHDYKV